MPHAASQMFELVNDIEAYPEFLHWCRAARIERSDPGSVEAALDIGIGGIHRTFRTRNTLTPPTEGAPGRIGLTLVSGPFRRLEGAWIFTDQASGGSEVALELDYELASTPLGMIFSAVFDEMARSQMNAFIDRAGRVYGCRD